MSRSSRISVKGTWPGTVVLRSGWSKAVARPWHDEDDRASLRTERGGPAFLEGCARRLIELGASGVLSAPVFATDTGMWSRAGFVTDRELVMMSSSLAGLPPTRIELVEVAPERAAAIDAEAFGDDWRIGPLGIADALGATPISALFADPDVSGFVILGVAGTSGYLQRIAVRPSHQGRGLGRELLRASMGWVRRSGATTMLLNTQPENLRAIALYRSEGFVEMPSRLSVMRWQPDPGTAHHDGGHPTG